MEKNIKYHSQYTRIRNKDQAKDAELYRNTLYKNNQAYHS